MENTEMKITRTTDLSLAVFLAWKGVKEAIPPWRIVDRPDGKRALEFAFQDVDPELLSEYRRDDYGIQRYNGLRKFFLRIVHSEMGDENDK